MALPSSSTCASLGNSPRSGFVMRIIPSIPNFIVRIRFELYQENCNLSPKFVFMTPFRPAPLLCNCYRLLSPPVGRTSEGDRRSVSSSLDLFLYLLLPPLLPFLFPSLLLSLSPSLHILPPSSFTPILYFLPLVRTGSVVLK